MTTQPDTDSAPGATRDELAREATRDELAREATRDELAREATRDELIAFLNELLEAERAGARVAAESARAAGTGPFAALLRTLQQDEAHWCAMLSRQLKALGETPSPKVGAFHDKAMAIPDLAARLVFLNRGQGWVVRKVREMLPRVPDDQLKSDLTGMLRAHETNIALANDVVVRTAPA